MSIDMAGYDIVVQLNVDTVKDAISVPFENMPGQQAFLFGGPFFVARDLPASGVFQGARFAGTATVQPIPQTGDQNLVRLRLSLEDGVLSGPDLPQLFSGLDGTARITLPLGLGYLAGLQPDGTWPADKAEREAEGAVFPAEFATGLVLDPAGMTVSFRFGPQTRARIVQRLSEAFAATAEGAISAGFEAVLDRLPQLAVPPGFGALRVRPGAASTEFDQLADWPVLRWLSPRTVAIFGDYGFDAGPKNPAQKDGHSDIDGRAQKFIYPGSAGNQSAIPAPAAALGISIAAIRRFAFCPAIRDGLAQEAVVAVRAKAYRKELQNRDRDFSPTEQRAYYARLAEAAKTNGIQQAMELALAAAALAGAREWAASPAAIPAIIFATPPDCGAGSAVFPVDIPIWPDGHYAVTRAHIATRDANPFVSVGHIATGFRAKARVPPGVGADASVSITSRLSVDPSGQRIEITHDAPVVTTDASGAAVLGALVGFLTAPFGGVGWGIIIGAAVTALTEALVSKLGPGILADEVGKALGKLPSGLPVEMPGQPMARLDDISAGASGITVFARIGRNLTRNSTERFIRFRHTRISRVPDPDVRTERGVYRKAVSCQDGRPREFPYQITAWREGFSIWVEHLNIPLPLHFEEMQIQLGDELIRSTDRRGLLQPHWRDPVPLTAPTTVVPGPAEILKVLQEARIADEITIGVAETGPTQWEMTTRAVDGNYALRIFGVCIDGGGTRHQVSGALYPRGLVLEFDAAIEAEGRACLAQMKRELAKIPPIAELEKMPPWAPVWDPVPWVFRGRIQRALLANDRLTLATFDQRAVQKEMIALGPLLGRGKIGPGVMR